MLVGRFWWVKVLVLSLVLFGVLWMMSTLQDGSYFRSPSSPVQLLIGNPAENNSILDTNLDAQPKITSGPAAGIRAKIQFEKPVENPKPTK